MITLPDHKGDNLLEAVRIKGKGIRPGVGEAATYSALGPRVCTGRQPPA
ncbi:hypothetical protein SBA3_2270011 [Candidatus Sulfopaludibacter sp. SbA3]|nr:hypothetical protein SBA3_2270011 [Candidatus Sulfopaludibacter sp. SbA3]